MNKVTIAVVLYNGEKLIPQLAETLASLPGDIQTVIYDSGSTDGSVQFASQILKNAIVVPGGNHGFGYGNNRCIEKVNTEYVLLLNSDASIDPESLTELVSFLDENPEFAGVQPLIRLWGWDKVTASCGVFLTEYGEAWDSRFMHLELFPLRTPIQAPAITAAVSLWRKSALDSVKGFDEHFFMYFEDADLSLRLGAAGWKLGVVRAARAAHMIGFSSIRRKAREWELESSIRMFRRYFGNGRLSFKWWKREARIILSCVLRGQSPLWRMIQAVKALRSKVDTVSIPEEVRSMLSGDPMNHPKPRIEQNSRGPGWNGNIASPWGGIKTDSKSITFKLTALEHTVTGCFSSGNGHTLRRFCIPAHSTMQIKFAETPPLVYIHCDSYSDRIEVRTD